MEIGCIKRPEDLFITTALLDRCRKIVFWGQRWQNDFFLFKKEMSRERERREGGGQ
jgi:hypothetical protein